MLLCGIPAWRCWVYITPQRRVNFLKFSCSRKRAKGHQTKARYGPGREDEGDKGGLSLAAADPRTPRRAGPGWAGSPGTGSTGAAAAAGWGNHLWLRLFTGVCGPGKEGGKEGGRLQTRIFCWSVSSPLFYFLLKDKKGVRRVCGKREDRKSSRNDTDQSRTRLLSPARPRVAMGRGK